MRVAIIASSRYPVADPFAGGLESHVWHLTQQLAGRGHQVSVFAAEGSRTTANGARVEAIVPAAPRLSREARADVSMPAEWVMAEHHAYLRLMLDLAGSRGDDFDVVHNHSLHHLPLAMAPALRRPMLTTLHTPPTPWLESALQTRYGRTPGRFVAVSAHTARAWQQSAGPVETIANGVDLAAWPEGPGGGPAVWSGRLVPEKGPHLAVEAARAAGVDLVLVGPRSDEDYFESHIAPQLDEHVTYAGHLGRADLSRLVRHASVSLVTPCWDEPYGLVVAESLASGTPVAAFRRGGIPEIVDESSAVLAAPDDVDDLARAILSARSLSRADCRARAEEVCSLAVMTSRYEQVYEQIAAS
ncbi:glycosyltransferase family 4 protein [Jatrophihabitans sp. YIM 134969]